MECFKKLHLYTSGGAGEIILTSPSDTPTIYSEGYPYGVSI